MSHTITIRLVALSVLLCAAPVFAEETTTIEAEASLETTASPMAPLETLPTPGTVPPGKMPMRPLDAIKAKAQQIKNNAIDAKKDLRVETKAQLKMAPPGEKREVLQNAFQERKDIAKERFASTTQLARGVKALVKMHGGEIRNRFRLAINHMNNLLGRVGTRLEKMTENGIDTSSVTELKAEADLAVDTAEANVLAIGTYIESVSDSSDRATVKSELQVKIKTAQDSIKKAQEAVKKVVRALVELAKNNKAKVDASAATETSI